MRRSRRARAPRGRACRTPRPRAGPAIGDTRAATGRARRDRRRLDRPAPARRTVPGSSGSLATPAMRRARADRRVSPEYDVRARPGRGPGRTRAPTSDGGTTARSPPPPRPSGTARLDGDRAPAPACQRRPAARRSSSGRTGTVRAAPRLGGRARRTAAGAAAPVAVLLRRRPVAPPPGRRARVSAT